MKTVFMANYNRNSRGNQQDWDDMDQNSERTERNASRKNSYNDYERRNQASSNWHDMDERDQSSGQERNSGRPYGSGQGTFQHRDYGYGGNRFGSNNFGSGERGNFDRNNSRGFSKSSYNDNNDRNFDDYSNSGRDNQGYSRNNLYRNQHTGNDNYYGNGNAHNEGGYGSRENMYGNRPGNQDRNNWDRSSNEAAQWFGNNEADRRRQAERQQDNRGRGPKGYRRSDERITEDINDRLSDDYAVDASDIEINVTNGEVSLSGTVTDRQAKRRAEDIVESISGVSNVENRIRVKQEQNSELANRKNEPGKEKDIQINK